MEFPETNLNLCSNCQREVGAGDKFCRRCGTIQQKQETLPIFLKKESLQQIAWFFGIELLFCSLNLIIKERSNAINFMLQIAMALSAMCFFGYNWKQNKTILKWPNFSFKIFFLLTAIAAGTSYLVHFLVDHLNQILETEQQTFIYDYIFQPHGYYVMVISMAVFPAIFEELAYRGFLMQKLLNVVDDKEAIYISSILFFLIHFSLVSFFWLLPFALLLGYVRIKYRTLWYGVAMHFIFNLTACLIEIHNFGFDFSGLVD